MADQEEEEDVQSPQHFRVGPEKNQRTLLWMQSGSRAFRKRMKHSLLIGLKTTVEGLLATTSSNVWSTYGGLNRLCKDMERILHHRLKFIVEDYGNVMDFWPFVKGLRWLNPVMTPTIERIRKGHHQKGVSKGQVWLQESLQEHNLVAQLKVLVGNEQHLHRHYFDDAFLFCEQYFTAMCLCLQAVEENNVSLLAEIDAKLLNYIPSLRRSGPSPLRSVSLPVSTRIDPGSRPSSNSSPIPYQPSQGRRHHTSITEEVISESADSVLSASYEAPCTTASSTSPDELRETASESLRKVLGKRSRSPTQASSPDPTHRCHSFSLYDSLNTDPLLSVDFLHGSKSPNVSQENIAQENDNQSAVGGVRKSALKRSASEVVVSKREIHRRASDILDSKILEDNDEVFPPVKSSTLKDSGVRSKTPRPSRVIFSDSETVEEVNSTASKSKQTKIHHKRSRSDISGIKTALTEDQAEKGMSGRVMVGETSPISHFDHTDYGGSGFFRRPVQGQSLIHYLSSQDFHTCADLDKENAHFAISEALIAAIEQMKWNHLIGPQESLVGEEEEGEESDEEIKQLQQRIRIRKRERLKEKARGFPAFSDGRTDTTPTTSHSKSTSSFSSAMESDGADSEDSSIYEDKQIELSFTDDTQGTVTNLRKSGLSLSMASLYSDADIHKAIPYERETSQMESGSYYSAESVAISLLKKFSEKQIPKASELQWLVTEQEAPQTLLPLPNSYPVSPDDADSMSGPKSAARTRLRGNMEWAPPRAQIIFMVHPTPRRNSLLVKQNYRCAGCGMKVETGYAKRYRYCEYLGKYFCQCCHGNHSAYIPGRILKRWDFTKYYVSNFARDFLNKIENEPLFNVSDINTMLYKKVKLLVHIREWRTQLHHLKSLLSLCKQATSLSGELSKLPQHWPQDVHLYSLCDLVSVKSGTSGYMYSQLKQHTTAAISHVEKCSFCQCFGFICEVCRDQRDVIFPYQLQKVAICQGCKTCFHIKCFDAKKCPKCARIEARKKKLAEEEQIKDVDDVDER